MIDENRIKHIMAVARVMKANAKKFGLDEEEMFTLGMLHDVGYEFGDGENHHVIGAKILQKQGYKYFMEVLYHGMPTDKYSSKALDLLNFADLSVTRKGEVVGFVERLQDIKSRRGEDSPHYKNCKLVIDGLKKKYGNLLEEGKENE